MEERFVNAFSYKLIYIFRINDKTHKGLLKIGDATLKSDESIDKLPPNCRQLNQAAKDRIKEYTNTAAIQYELLHTELAVRTDDKGTIVAFRDHDVHSVLVNSRIPKQKINNSTSREWFKVDLETAKRAIEAVKKYQPSLHPSQMGQKFTPIVFRPEQLEAINATLKEFKTRKSMLWNAKMRFGKTISALEVVRKSGFAKTIIVTHRPVVDSGWYEDFSKIFFNEEDYIYGSKNNGYTIDKLISDGRKFVYFASMQDLRGSDKVGGKFNKNDAVFNTKWDFVIVDEAHEGTTTSLGEEVINAIMTDNTKFLALSGTPFNILGNYDNNVYTWDYIMEQRCKDKWNEEHFGDSNPYDELPKMNIFVYDLGKLLGNRYVELEDKAFNFHEFFRTWTGDIRRDFKAMPESSSVGDFVHEDDIRSFLNLITKEDSESHYPYSSKKYRDLFKHSLWILPGVKEAKALSKMLRHHEVFQFFKVVNVAGDGDEEEGTESALKKVRDAIKQVGDDGYTITLSCGKLTTGVTVKEWTTVFMLAGSFSTSAANYLQTIFRVQSPCNQNGKIKDNCYVFDFAPDRTLKMVAESVALSTKAGKATESDKKIMGEFLNYCPVISIDGTMMKKYSTKLLLQQLKKAYAERAVQNGFDDTNLYNDELLKLSDVDLAEFEKLKGIIGTSKAQQKTKDIDLNKQGFTNEEYKEEQELSKKSSKQRTPEEQARLDELKEKKKNRGNAISILRGISIRMPLLIYGADIPIDEEFTLDKFLDDKIIDEASWSEFMPSGITREVFRQFMKYYDEDIFIAAGRRIRNTVLGADELSPTERVKQIAMLFSCFKNPDKETVLTPWRVVNMHMSDCLGGYSFYEENPPVNAQMLEQPRFVDRKLPTAETFGNYNSHILEINSKTGLYPLYVVYSIFRTRCNEFEEDELTIEKQNELWEETVRENIFIICKTPMAKFITKRTLVGYRNIPVNAHYFDDLINTMQNKQRQFIDRVIKPSYWHRKGDNMKFDAVVGNPPYQIMDGGAKASAKPVYNFFVEQAEALSPEYVSMIMPARWYSGGKGLDAFREMMLNDKHLKQIHDFVNANDCFTNVEIKGGICYFLWDSKYSGNCLISTHENNAISSALERPLLEKNSDTFIRDNQAVEILRKVYTLAEPSFSSIVHSAMTFGFRTFFKTFDSVIPTAGTTKIYANHSQGYIFTNKIKKGNEYIGKWKVYIPEAIGSGDTKTDVINPILGEPNSIATETYIMNGPYDSEEEAKNAIAYINTKFFHFMLGLKKFTQHTTQKVYQFIPLQDFTDDSDINWHSERSEIDNQLYKKYKFSPLEISYIENSVQGQRKKR